MNLVEAGRRRGRQLGASIDAQQFIQDMHWQFAYTLKLFPTLGDIDLAAAIRAYDRERLACEPHYGNFPEMKGLLDRHLGERDGFRETSGLDEVATAYFFSWRFFITRRVSAQHLGRYDLLDTFGKCSNVFIPESVEGGVVLGDNRDDVLYPQYRETIKNFQPTHLWPQLHESQPLGISVGGVSSSMLFDEEPECSFPCDPFELMPEEVKDDIHAIVEFMTRYREFYGPANYIFCDRKLNAVAVEKTNCRVAFRWPRVNGAIGITSCSYLDPELHAFKDAGTRKAMAIKGETEDNSIDWHFFASADKRNRRIIHLTDEAARRGGSLWDVLHVVADPDGQYPARIWKGGERKFPDREPNGGWTLTQHAAVVTGPHRRVLYRSLDTAAPQPIVTIPLKCMLGHGVAMQPEWQQEIDDGQYTLVSYEAPASVA